MEEEKFKNIVIGFLLVIAILLLCVLIKMYFNNKNNQVFDTSKHEALIKSEIKNVTGISLIGSDNNYGYYLVKIYDPMSDCLCEKLEIVSVSKDVNFLVNLDYLSLVSFEDAPYDKYRIENNTLYLITNGCGNKDFEQFKAGTEFAVTFKDGKVDSVKEPGTTYKLGTGNKC